MGLFSWLAKRKVDNAVKLLKGYVGKDSAELDREGGWDILVGAQQPGQWQSSNEIWRSFSDRDMEIAYSLASLIHACVRLKCITANQVTYEVGEWTKKGWFPAENHVLYDLLRRPNGGQDTSAFIWDVVSHAELTGWSYIWKLRSKGGQIIALQPLPTSWIRRSYAEKSGELIAYIVKRTGTDKELIIAPEDMFYIQYPNPADPTQAAGPMQAALRDLQIDDARSDLLIEMLVNIHFPGTIIKSKNNWTPGDKEEARQVLQDLIGQGRRAKPLFINGNETEVELPSAPKDVDWPGTAAQSETRVCAAFGVPPVMVHLRAGLDRATFSNVEGERKSFYNDTMRSLWELIASAFERGLLIDEGQEELEVEPDFTRIPEMQEDQDALHKRVRDDFHGGLHEWNEAVELIGGKPLPGRMGKVYALPMGLQIIETSSTPGGTAQQLSGTEVDDDLEEDDEHLEDADVDELEEEEEDAIDDAEDGKTGSIIIASS